MAPYRLKKAFLALAIALPAPRFLARLARLYHEVHAGENVADMTINGELAVLREHLPDCRVLFDVGAHHGEWTRHALASAGDLRVHCFEPIAAHHRELAANRFPAAVVCNHAGLSEQTGEQLIDVVTCSLHRHRDDEDRARETVRLLTLDGYCREHGIERVDFLKIDTEGHELAVLRGGREMIDAGKVARIQFEYGPCNADARVLLRDLFAFLAPFDYDLFKITARGPVPTGYERALENFQYKNFLALHGSLRGSG